MTISVRGPALAVALLLVAVSALSADEGDRAKIESIRQALVARFEEQRGVHVAYAFTQRSASSQSVRTEGTLDVYREGKLHGIAQTTRRGDKVLKAWYVADGSRIVITVNGKVTFAMMGPDRAKSETDKAQSVADRICKEWELPATSLTHKRVGFKISVDEIAGDKVRYLVGVGLMDHVGAAWLTSAFFGKKSVRVDTDANTVVLASERATMSIDRATGIPVSARAHKSSGGEISLVRRKVQLAAESWPSKIRSVLLAPGAVSMSAEPDLAFRAGLLYQSLRALAGQSPDELKDIPRLRRAANDLAVVILGSEAAGAHVASFVKERRGSSVSRSGARRELVELWLESMSHLREPSSSEGKKRITKAVDEALRRHAEVHFDATWSDEKGK